MIALLSGGASTTMLKPEILTDIGSILTSVVGWITANNYLLVFFTFSMVGVGISIFRSLKNVIKP